MSVSYTSYKPTFQFPSFEDPFFEQGNQNKRIPDEQEKDTMFRLADALMEVSSGIGKYGYSVITTRDGQMEKIKMRYLADDGEIEIAIYRNHIDYSIHRQYGLESDTVIDLCMLITRKMAGYFAYIHDDLEPPYDPIEREDELPPIAVKNLEERLANRIAQKKKKLSWWKCWEK